MDYIYSGLCSRLTTERAHKLQYIFINKYALENMRPKEWTEEEMFLAKDMHLAEEVERMEQNLLRIEREEDEDRKDEEDEEENRPFAECNEEEYRDLII